VYRSPTEFLILWPTGNIPSGSPEFGPPRFSITNGNATTIGFVEMVSELGSGIVVLPMLAVIEELQKNVVSKRTAARNRMPISPNTMIGTTCRFCSLALGKNLSTPPKSYWPLVRATLAIHFSTHSPGRVRFLGVP
jgi:hypothetical protein